MHRTAFALANAGFAAEELCHHAVDGPAFRDIVAVAPVRANDIVVRPQMRAKTSGHGLFAAIHVKRALNVAECRLPVRLFLEKADPPHRAVHVLENVRRRFHGAGPVINEFGAPRDSRGTGSTHTIAQPLGRTITRSFTDDTFSILLITDIAFCNSALDKARPNRNTFPPTLR